GPVVAIDLIGFQYNTNPNMSCAKNEVRLEYGADMTLPLSLAVVVDKVLARMHTLSAVSVMSRANCEAAPERLRRYELSYLPDADTQQPRLQSVRMFGRQGTPEENIALPVASY